VFQQTAGERRCFTCQDSTHHGTQAGLAWVSEEAEALAGAGVEASEDAGLAGVRATAGAGAGEPMVQAGQALIGAPIMALPTGKIVIQERRCFICQD